MLQIIYKLIGHSARCHDAADSEMQQAEQQGGLVLAILQAWQLRNMDAIGVQCACFAIHVKLASETYANLCCLVGCTPG